MKKLLGEDSSNGKSYEVSKTPATKSIDSNSLIYALVGVLAIGILISLDFWWTHINIILIFS